MNQSVNELMTRLSVKHPQHPTETRGKPFHPKQNTPLKGDILFFNFRGSKWVIVVLH